MRHRKFLFATLAATVLAGLVTPLRPTVVQGQSMAPTLRSGSLYVLDTHYYRHHRVERGDIVVFRYRGETCAKRIYALPGEHILLFRYGEDAESEVVEALEAPALRRLERAGRLPGRRLEEVTVPSGHYFVLGDNRPVSWDSRSFGFLPRAAILGKVSL
jgi:signal peptidase I